MAINSFQLFLSQIQTAPEVLKIRVLEIVFDILIVHEGEFLGRDGQQVLSFPDFIYLSSILNAFFARVI